MAQFSGGRKSNPLKRVQFVFLSFSSSSDLGDERKETRPSERRTKDKGVNQCDHDIVGACDGTDATSLSWFGWHSPLRKSPLFWSISLVCREPLLGGTKRKKGRGATMHGTSRPCLRGTVERATHECCRVGRANNSNAFGLFFEQESQRYLTFTMIRTPSSYGGARGDLSSIWWWEWKPEARLGSKIIKPSITVT